MMPEANPLIESSKPKDELPRILIKNINYSY